MGTCNKKAKRALELSLYNAQSPLIIKIFRKFDIPIKIIRRKEKGERENGKKI
jgi:hypothetical protein